MQIARKVEESTNGLQSNHDAPVLPQAFFSAALKMHIPLLVPDDLEDVDDLNDFEMDEDGLLNFEEPVEEDDESDSLPSANEGSVPARDGSLTVTAVEIPQLFFAAPTASQQPTSFFTAVPYHRPHPPPVLTKVSNRQQLLTQTRVIPVARIGPSSAVLASEPAFWLSAE
ncbi:hypothetical protein HDV05_007560 [Chytridiales sp. JEL 0842]|nr:hypothetical protein HDV05_007560 [Chytridiales sp. JEL 0842]